MASNDEYQQVQFWKKKEVTLITVTDSGGYNWTFVHNPVFDGEIKDGEIYKNVTKQIIYEN